jgi:hypothetical protein
MNSYAFTIVASGLDPEADDFEDRFFEAGCDDATVSFQKGRIILEFEREARGLAHAITSAAADVRKAGARIERFEPDHLVNLSDIAARSGLSKSAISLYWKGERGAGFPLPIARVTSESPLWDWVEVSGWMHAQKKLPYEAVLEARLMREANAMIERKNVPFDQFTRTIEEIAAA